MNEFYVRILAFVGIGIAVVFVYKLLHLTSKTKIKQVSPNANLERYYELEQNRNIDLNCSKNEAHELILEVLNNNFKVKILENNPELGVIVSRVAAGLRSFGEILEIKIESNGSLSKIQIYCKPRYGFISNVWGKTYENVEKLTHYLKLHGKYQEKC